MKFSKLSLGMAAACGLMSSSAFALPLSSYTNTSEFVGDTLVIRMSGATAQDPGVLAATLRFCTAGSMTAYLGSTNTLYFCTIDSTVLSGVSSRLASNGVSSETPTKLALFKYSVGGSGNGVGPVNSASNLPFLAIDKLKTACEAVIGGTNPATNGASGTASAGTALSTYEVYTCGAAASNLTTNAVSYIGISDVEPAFFGAASTYNNLDTVGLATLIFAVPVTRNVYDKLQQLQGIATAGDFTNSPRTGCASDALRLTEACMPSLTQTQVTSIYTQKNQTWANLLGSSVSSVNDRIFVARRVDSSGTQKTFEAVVARTPNGNNQAKSCTKDIDAFVFNTGSNVANDTAATNNTSNTSATNPILHGNGTPNVTKILELRQDSNVGAVGVLTTETKIGAASKYLFVKINGYAPTQANVAAGKYTAYAEVALNTRGSSGASPTLLADNYSNFITKFKAQFSDKAIIKIMNGNDQPFGASGLMVSDALTSPALTPDFTGANSRNPWSRLVAGTTLNNCQAGKLHKQ